MFSLALDAAYLKMGRGRTALVNCCLMGGVAQLSYHLSPIFPGALRSWLWCLDRGGCRVWSCRHANTPQLLWLSKEAAPGRTARLAAAVAPSNSGTRGRRACVGTGCARLAVAVDSHSLGTRSSCAVCLVKALPAG